jgi:hypothetical protein
MGINFVTKKDGRNEEESWGVVKRRTGDAIGKAHKD